MKKHGDMSGNVGGNRKGKRHDLEVWIFPTPFPSYDFRTYIKWIMPIMLDSDIIHHSFQANDPQGLRDAGLDVAECAQLICDTFAEMIFVHGRVHADPHAGNIYFKAGGERGAPPESRGSIERLHRKFALIIFHGEDVQFWDIPPIAEALRWPWMAVAGN